MSIQGMMFTPDPCFNEPGYEGIRGTDEGDVSNRNIFSEALLIYTLDLRLQIDQHRITHYNIKQSCDRNGASSQLEDNFVIVPLFSEPMFTVIFLFKSLSQFKQQKTFILTGSLGK